MGQQSAKEASNLQTLYAILLVSSWRAQKSSFFFCFLSLNSKCVTFVCLQFCSLRKQNCYCFLGKITSIDKRTVNLRVIFKAYLIDQSLVNILSQIPVQ